MYKNCAVIITAAGFSGRMGSHKALLEFGNHVTFIEKIIETYSLWGCSKVVVIVNSDLKRQFPALKHNINTIVNLNPEKEMLHSIQLGIQYIDNVDFCFVQPVDNPFITNILLQSIFDSRKDNNYVVPLYNGKGGHPVLLSRYVIDNLSSLTDTNLKFNEILKKYNRINIETNSESVLYNINTPEDFYNFTQKINDKK